MKNKVNRSFWMNVLILIVVLGSVCFAGDVVVKEGDITAVGDLDMDGAVVLNKSGTSTDDFVFGSPQLADDGNTAHDYRFWFDKSKGAFRTGVATGGEWDDANVGNSSFAAGRNNIASGNKSAAIGANNLATATRTLAAGWYCEATGGNGVAIGTSASATEMYAVSIGWGADSNGSGSTAIGTNVTAEGDYSVVIGNSSETNGFSSTAIGHSVIVDANDAVALGQNFTNSTANSFAVGFEAKDFEVKSDYAKVYGDMYVEDDLTVTDTATISGNTTLGNASTDTITCTGRWIPRTVAADPTGTATAGSLGEIVFYNDKWYGKTVADGTDTNWSALN